MEDAALVSDRPIIFPVLASAELSKVLGCLWHHILEQLHLDAADLIPSDRNIKKNHWVILVPDDTGHARFAVAYLSACLYFFSFPSKRNFYVRKI